MADHQVKQKHVAIAGAGIAGLSAAQVLIDAGLSVTVLEKSATPGGKCSSYFDSELGHTVEHGVHGVFPRYENLRALWSDANINDAIFSRTRTTGMAGADRKMHGTELAKARGPAPFFLLGLTPRGVLRLRDFFFSIGFLTRTYAARWASSRALDEATFGAVLRRSGISRRMADLLLVPYVRNLAYARGDEVSARVALEALNYYVVERADAVKAQWIDGGPGACIFEPWWRELEKRGVRFEFQRPVESIVMSGDRFVGFGMHAAISDRELGTAPRLWTQQVGHHFLGLSWIPTERRLRAFHAKCTHQGCPLSVAEGASKPVFHCACHGGQFDSEGRVLKAPPKKPLEEVALRHDPDNAVWFVKGTDPTTGEPDEGLTSADYAVIAMDIEAVKSVLPKRLTLAESTGGIPLLRTTSVMVLRLRFQARPDMPRWQGPDSGVFAADDALDNFFALHTFQREFAAMDDLFLECHIGDSERIEALDDGAVLDLALDTLDAYFPNEALPARLDRKKSRVLRHQSIFSLFAPGDFARMPTVTHADRPNLFFAGDWIRPDDPAHRSFFMERAAVTGIEAANAILRAEGLDQKQRPIGAPTTPFVSRLISWPLRASDSVIRAIRKVLGVAYE